MAAVAAPPASPRPADLHLGPAEQELYAGILASAGTLVSAYAASPRDGIDVFRMAYALLDGLPPHVVIGVAAEAMRARYSPADPADQAADRQAAP